MLYIKIIQNRVLLYRDYRFTVWEQSVASPRGKSRGLILAGRVKGGGREGRKSCKAATHGSCCRRHGKP